LTLVRVMAADAAGAMATNSFYLTVRSVVDPIVIRTQPEDVIALVGGNPAFSVVAESVLPLTYQWQFGADDLVGETSTLLNVLAVQPNQAGSYRVIISSTDQSIVSRSALLTLVDRAPSPRITGIARNQSGATVSFETIAGGTYTLEYKVTLDAGDWVAIGSVAGTGSIRTILDPAPADQTRFYRVRVE
jgi:hypothetical protein